MLSSGIKSNLIRLKKAGKVNLYRLGKIAFALSVIVFTSACSSITSDPPAQPTVLDKNTSDISTRSGLSTEPALSVSPTPHIQDQTGQLKSTPAQAPSKPNLNNAAHLPDPDKYQWVRFVNGLVQPLYLTHTGDGSKRIYIVEQPGVIQSYRDGSLQPDPYLDIQERVGSSGSEQGLLGLAFHPHYTNNGYFFVNYTNLEGDTIISRFQRSDTGENTGNPQSEKVLMKIPQPFANHNGGQIAFGLDGLLYIGTGDGGSAGDPQGNSQSLKSLLGKILRIDVDHGDPYKIPSDNPFVSGAGLGEIWAYGLRNPWRFSFDKQTGDIYIADVGQNKWEEVNFSSFDSENGQNFGWNYLEASHIYLGHPPEDLVLVAPAAEYGHEMGCSITGGVVYRGSQLAELYGVYLYGDYCTGNVWGLVRDSSGKWENGLLYSSVARISSFGEDESGEIYIVDHSGSILQLTAK